MDVVGYTDRVSVAPGEHIRFMLSATDPAVAVDLVRVVHGDESGPGVRIHHVASSLTGRYAARPQSLRTGSYVRCDGVGTAYLDHGFDVELWTWPTHLGAGRQTLVGHQDPGGRGWFLDLTEDGHVQLTVAGTSGERTAISTRRQVRENHWYHVVASFDRAENLLHLQVRPRQEWPSPSAAFVSEPEHVRAPGPAAIAAPEAPLLFAASAPPGGDAGPSQHFNGKLADVRLRQGARTADGRSADDGREGGPVVGAWDFSLDTETSKVTDVSGNGIHGETLQMPTRAVTGPDWRHDVTRFADDPSCYNAIHFHDDDLDDAAWEPTMEWTVDESLPSGVYAAHVRGTTRGDDYVPVIVRPPRTRATSPILLVLPLFSYVAYGNLRALDEYLATDTPHGNYIKAHRLNSLYDSHTDGTGVCYSSWRRPLLNFRPGFRLPLLDSAHQFSADLHLVDWLVQHGHEFDVVTDEDLHHEGAALLSRYQVVLSGSHAEYWTGAMLDAVEDYLTDGGRFMYLSGNGMYWVTGLDQETGHTIEVRRHGAAVSAWHCLPGEGSLSTTGEPGGLWRARGRAPQRLVGVGFSGCWADTPAAIGCGYQRTTESRNPRARFIFNGIGEEVIGDFPNLVLRHGAAGHEVDRADESLGTPAHALVVASATDFPADHWNAAPEEMGRGQVRADIVFFETRNGGAVFSTGSITWCGALSHDNYTNNVSRVTRNVLERFLNPEPFTAPSS